MSIDVLSTAAPAPAQVPIQVPVKTAEKSESFGFGDFLDIINPLQHIPVIGTLYRQLTGDTMSATAEILGGALYGGVVGAVGSVADVLFHQETGKDFGDTVLSWLGFEGKASDTQLASATASRGASAYRNAASLQTTEIAEWEAGE